MRSKRTIRSTDDPIWKSILEQTFSHFLTFFFPEAAEVFDLDKGFDYLDKEFETLFPPEANNKGVRYVDKLVKVRLIDGGEQFVLCHIEVQSKKGKGDLSARMFEYFYKIYDKYKVPITAIAILADSNKKYQPSVYSQEFMGTKLIYEFNSYKIISQNEESLRADPNPFAVVALTSLMSIKYKHISDEDLKGIKHDLYDEMMKRKMEKSVRQGIYDFLTYYVRFENPQMLSIFEQEVEHKQGRSTTVGTREYLLEKAKNEGLEKGLEKGKIEEATAIAIEMKKEGLTVEQIVKFTKLSVEEIEKLK